jgi:hypothetical protein
MTTVLTVSATAVTGAGADDINVRLGPLPFYLIDKMSPGPLKDKLQRCADNRSPRRISRSATAAAARSSSRSTRRRVTRQARAWAPAFSRAT